MYGLRMAGVISRLPQANASPSMDMSTSSQKSICHNDLHHYENRRFGPRAAGTIKPTAPIFAKTAAMFSSEPNRRSRA
jgi:hypothetical protein